MYSIKIKKNKTITYGDKVGMICITKIYSNLSNFIE